MSARLDRQAGRQLQLGCCGGVRKVARIAFHGLDARGRPDAGLYFEDLGEFDSFALAAAAVREADATLRAFWAERALSSRPAP